MPDDRALEEYKDVSANLRHYSNLRFAQLTIFVAATIALLALVVKPDPKAAAAALVSAKLAGVVIAIAFWLMEERIVRYWEHHRSRAERLEEALSFEQYRTRARGVFVTGRAAARLLFVASLLFWAVLLLLPERF